MWEIRGGVARLSEGMKPAETTITGGETPIKVQIMQDPVVYSKTINGTLVTWTGPARNDGESEKEYGARTWALWEQFCAGLPE